MHLLSKCSPQLNLSKLRKLYPWLVSLTAALFFFYEFIQMNFFNSLSADLMQTFSINAEQLGYLSSCYFYANILFLFPAGILLDRISTKKIIVISMCLCILGTFLFSLTTNLIMAGFCRFITGIGGAFCFLSCIRLASRWFSSLQMASITGAIVTMAMIGGSIAQEPMTYLAIHFGWQQAVRLDAMLGFVFLLFILAIVQDYPPGQKPQQNQNESMGVCQSLKKAYFNKQNWLCGFYTSFMNSPVAILGALWGTIYLEKVQMLSNEQASSVSGMIFIGMILGSPFWGFISDHFQRRKRFMILGTILILIDMLAILYAPIHTFSSLATLFFLLGFVSGAQIISYATVSESNPKHLTATSVSVISFITISGYAIFQPLFGYFMDWRWKHLHIKIQPVYQASDFSYAVLILPILFLMTFVILFLIRETYAKQVGD